MSTRSPEIITRASEVDEDLVPEPWDPRDSKSDRSLVAERERYRLDGVTGEDGAGIVPAYNLNVADTGSIPSKTKDGWTRGSAGRVLGPDGRYVSRGSDVPRLSFDGDEAGLLVEAAGRTNHVEYSADPSEWENFAVSQVSSEGSIIDGETAYRYTDTGDTVNAAQAQAGTFSSADSETVTVRLEEGTTELSGVAVFDDTDNVKPASCEIDWDSESLQNITADEANIRFENGPNGKVAVITLRYSNQTQGNVRELFVEPSKGATGNNTIIHHAQIEEAPNASSPIVTGGSPVTRSADDYAIFEGGQPDWWNPNEGTFYAKVRPKFYYFPISVMGLISDIPFNSSWIEVLNGSQPFSIRYHDGTNNDQLTNALSAYEPNKVAVSVAQNKVHLSSGGNSITGNHNGDLLSVDRIRLGSANNLLSNVEKLVYYPRALPESTLNRITS